MKQDELRQKLIDGTILVIANEGLDKATTKRISKQTGINEVYIYRCFQNKEDLFAQVFTALDERLLANLTQHFQVMYVSELEFEMRCRFFFFSLWSFLLGNREKCLAFVRYFYSPYYIKYSAEQHEKRYASFVKDFSEAFLDEADVWMILNHILNVMLDFAVKVHNGQMSGEDNYAEHVFRVIYASVKQYFKRDEVKSHG